MSLNPLLTKCNLTTSTIPGLERQPQVTFVPNDHIMIRDKSRLQILTGPNMGGKSTYARQVHSSKQRSSKQPTLIHLPQLGCIMCMAQIGSFIPAAEGAELPIIDAVLARVGAGE